MDIKRHVITFLFVVFSVFGSISLANASCSLQSLKECDIKGLISIIEEIIKKRSNINGELLLKAVVDCDTEKVKTLIKNGTNINYVRSYDERDQSACLRLGRDSYYSPLDHSCNEAMTKLLQANGAKTVEELSSDVINANEGNVLKKVIQLMGTHNGVNFVNLFPLRNNESFANRQINNPKISKDCKELLKNPSATKSFPLMVIDNPNLMKELIDLGAPVEKNALTRIYYYNKEHNKKTDIETIKMLIKAGADINAYDSSSGDVNNILTLAIKDNNITLVRELISLGADINIIMLLQTDDCIVLEKVPLMSVQNIETLKELLLSGANPSIELNGWRGEVIFDFIKRKKDISFIKEIIKFGANINSTTKGMIHTPGETYKLGSIITLAISIESDMVDDLVKIGADINLKDSKGYTLLMEASKTGSLEVSEGLINLGANINALDNNNGTALMEAAYYNNLDIVKDLVIMGANVKMKDKKGKTALDYAKEKNNLEIIDFLKNAENK